MYIRFSKIKSNFKSPTFKLHNQNIAILGADNMVVNTLKLFGHYYAATELPQIIEYDPVTLETIGKVDLTPLIPGNYIM